MTDTTTDDVEMEFVDALPTIKGGGAKGGNGKVQKFVAKLKERPGVWAIYTRSSSTPTATHQAKSNPGSQWAVRRNEAEDGDAEGAGDGAKPTYTVLARWCGVYGEHVPADDPNPPRWMKAKVEDAAQKTDGEDAAQDDGEATPRPKPRKKAAARRPS